MCVHVLCAPVGAAFAGTWAFLSYTTALSWQWEHSLTHACMHACNTANFLHIQQSDNHQHMRQHQESVITLQIVREHVCGTLSPNNMCVCVVWGLLMQVRQHSGHLVCGHNSHRVSHRQTAAVPLQPPESPDRHTQQPTTQPST
jgi:hypothetical protein